MYDYGYTDLGSSGGTDMFAMMGGIITIISMISMVFSIIMIISQWKIYKKAGKGGWESIVPIYNMVVLLQIVELPLWYLLLFMVPIANIYAMFKIYIELAHKFGKSTGFGVATVFFNFICLPILAFGKNNVYLGSGTNNINNQPVVNQNQENFQNQPSNVDNMNHNPNVETPISFDQNINTNINPIQNNMNDISNNIQTPEPIAFNPLPQPEVQINNIPTAPIENPQPELNNNVQEQGFQYNASNNAENQVQQPAVFNATPTQPVMDNNQMPQPMPEQQNPVGNVQQPQVSPQPINVIPNMGPTPEPTVQNPNNPNM